MADKTPVKQACTKIADLSIQQNERKWKICARVIRKSEKKWTDTNRVYFKVMLEDDTAKIEALVFSETNVKRLYPELEIKKVYYISNGKLKKVNKNYQSVGHDCEIYLDHTTTVVLCTNSADHPGNSPYTPIRELSSSQSALIDTIGELTMIGPLEMKISNDVQKPLRNIQLTDNSDDTTVPVALWGKQATEFKGIPLGRVISVRNVTVKTYQGNQVLYSTVNTVIDYNPTNIDVLHIRNHNCSQGGEITSTKKSEGTTVRAGSSGLAQVRRKILVEDTIENMSQESRTNSEEMAKPESATHVFANINFTTTSSNISDVENHGSWDVNDEGWIEDVMTTNDLTSGVDSGPEMPLTLQNNSEVQKSNPEFQRERKRRSDSELGSITASEAKKKNKWEKHERKGTPKHLADYRQLDQVPDAFENDPMAMELFESALRDGKEKDIFRGRFESVPGDDFHLTDKMLGTIAQMIGKNWQFLGLALGLSQVDIDHLEEENRNNLVMKIYKMLLKWKVMSETTTFNKLLAAMEKCADVTFDWDRIENFRDDILR